MKVLTPNKPTIELLEASVYMARTARLIDLGVQRREYKGEKKPSQQQFLLAFELPTELIDIDGVKKPRHLSRKYGISFSEKANLVKLLSQLKVTEEEFVKDPSVILNRPCQVEVTVYTDSQDKKRNAIGSVTQLMKGMQVAELFSDPKTFGLDDPDMEQWESFPDFIKEMIRNSELFSESPLFHLDVKEEING